MRPLRFRPLSLLLLACGMSAPLFAHAAHAALSTTQNKMEATPVSTLLGIVPSAESRDYVDGKQQFQLHTLLTEQRHPQTMDLSRRIQHNTAAGLDALFAVDRDVSATMTAVANDPARLNKMQAASDAMQQALRNGHRIYFYGTGSTGRLAETLESGLWRPFWARVASTPAWAKIQQAYPDIANRVRGEITGGDRALISSLEGFEDLQLIGRLQLEDNAIAEGDVVFAVTEGGETSAVIGTAKRGAELNHNNPLRTWFVYNNPDDVLLPFERSREVIEHPGISKINLTTGPQSITGSTRMQATTTSLYALGVVMENAIHALLKPVLDEKELAALGFDATATIATRLHDFTALQKSIAANAQQLALWTDTETATYATGHYATYLAQHALMPVFVDVTERAPTFRLAPLDRSDASKRRSWIQVQAPVETREQAWDALLHRPFHGLDQALYGQPFAQQISDPYLRQAAARSLALAGAEQQTLYDLSLASSTAPSNHPTSGDLGALILLGDEEINTRSQYWLEHFSRADATVFIVRVTDPSTHSDDTSVRAQTAPNANLLEVVVPKNDALELNRIIGLKMLLNAHSTGVMAKLGRVVGNTMTAVQPGNLKLIGRATYLLQSHVNAVLESVAWQAHYPKHSALNYADANAILMDVIAQRSHTPALESSPEVELCIVRVLESLKHGNAITWNEAAHILQQQTLDAYLAKFD